MDDDLLTADEALTEIDRDADRAAAALASCPAVGWEEARDLATIKVLAARVRGRLAAREVVAA
jgi:hypothetical protein